MQHLRSLTNFFIVLLQKKDCHSGNSTLKIQHPKLFIYLLTTFLIFGCTELLAQSMMDKKLHHIDSLETILQETSSDTSRLNTLYSLAEAYGELHKDSIATSYVEKHLALAKTATADEHLRRAYTENIHLIGSWDTLLYQQRYAEAVDYLEQHNDERGLAETKTALALYYNYGGKRLKLGKIIAEEALEIGEELGDDALRARAFFVLGEIACSDYLLKTSLDYFYEALAIGKLSPKDVNEALEGITINHYYLTQYDSVLIIGKELEKEYLRIGDLNGAINNTHILYAAYYMLDSIEQRIAYEDKLEQLVRENDMQSGAYANYFLDFGNSAYEEENYPRVIDCMQRALHYYQLPSAKENSSTIYKQFIAYNTLSISYVHVGQLDSSKIALEYSNIMMDSFYNYKSVDGLQELNIKYQTEKKEYEIERLNQEQELLRTRNQIYIIGSLFLLSILLLAAWSWWRLKQQNNVISTQKKKLETVNATKDRLFAIIGHDLRKPAIAFRGISKKINYLLAGKDYETLQRLGASIESNAFSLHKLTDNLLNWALQQRDILPYEPKLVQVEHLFDEINSVFGDVLREKQIQLKIDVHNSSVAYADYNSLSTVVRNLVDNAIKFTPQGGQVTIKTEKKQDKLNISVKDTGIGMSPEQLRQLFLLNKQKSTAGTAGEKGTGLGLYLANELTQLNQGTLKVASQPQNGTTFSVILPMQQPKRAMTA